eukprot:gene9056-6354_t
MRTQQAKINRLNIYKRVLVVGMGGCFWKKVCSRFSRKLTIYTRKYKKRTINKDRAYFFPKRILASKPSSPKKELNGLLCHHCNDFFFVNPLWGGKKHYFLFVVCNHSFIIIIIIIIIVSFSEEEQQITYRLFFNSTIEFLLLFCVPISINPNIWTIYIYIITFYLRV